MIGRRERCAENCYGMGKLLRAWKTAAARAICIHLKLTKRGVLNKDLDYGLGLGLFATLWPELCCSLIKGALRH